MSFKRKLDNTLSLENDGAGTEDELQIPEVAAEIGETVDGAAVEQVEAETEVAEEAKETDALEAESQALESLLLTLESIQASGTPMTAREARLARGWAGAIVGKYDAVDDAMVSMESFDSTSASARALTLSMEKIGQMLKDFWNAILAQLKKLYAAVRNWYLKVLDTAPRLKKKAEAVRNRADDTNGTAKEKKVEMGLLRALHIGGKAPSASGVISGLTGVDTISGKLLTGKSAEAYESAAENIIGVIDAGGDLAAKKGVFIKAVEAGVATLKSDTGATGSGNVGDRYKDSTVTSTSEMLGGKAILVRIAKNTGEKFAGTVKNSGASVERFAAKEKEVSGSGQFEVLSTGDVMKICDLVISICDHVIGYKKLWDSRDTHLGKVDSAAKRAIAEVEKDKEAKSDAQRATRDVFTGVNGWLRNGVTFTSNWISYALATARAALSYGEKSLGQYKSE